MSRYTILLALLLLVFAVQAQTNTFIGSSPGVWHEARNWSLKQIPTASHDAVIQGKEVIIESNQGAVAKSVLVDGRSYLEVQNGASLSIDNSSAIGLHNMGKTLIDGRLTVENVAGTSTFNNHCILNDGLFYIGSAGWVHLEDTGGCGLTVSDAGELENSGEIWVYGTNTGIRVRGLLENHNFIYVEPDQSHGMELRGGKVKNTSRAELRIEGSHFGVLLFEDVVTSEQSLFENFGLVRAERMDWWGVSVSDGEFYNFRGAQVKTMYSQQGSGISLGPDGKFLNYSSIETRYNFLDGVHMQGEFQNHGNLFSSHNGRYGIFLLTFSGFNQPGLFENHNDVEIFDNDSASIQCNTAFYHNMDDGITVHYNILRGDKYEK